jgi:hypothetical protein
LVTHFGVLSNFDVSVSALFFLRRFSPAGGDPEDPPLLIHGLCRKRPVHMPAISAWFDLLLL